MNRTKQKQTHRYKEQTSGEPVGRRKGGRARQGYRIERYKVLCIK